MLQPDVIEVFRRAPSHTHIDRSDRERWFGHDPARWKEFRRRYSPEVKAHVELLQELRDLAQRGLVTLLSAARGDTHNEAVALRDQLLGRPDARLREGAD